MVPLFEIPQEVRQILQTAPSKNAARAREFFRYHMEMCEMCGKMIDWNFERDAPDLFDETEEEEKEEGESGW